MQELAIMCTTARPGDLFMKMSRPDTVLAVPQTIYEYVYIYFVHTKYTGVCPTFKNDGLRTHRQIDHGDISEQATSLTILAAAVMAIHFFELSGSRLTRLG